VILPGIQEYVIVPPGIAKAAIVPVVPSQIGGGPEANTVGFGVPNNKLVVALHPLASVKVTVYVTPFVTLVKLPVLACVKVVGAVVYVYGKVPPFDVISKAPLLMP
jgi:hypothetical protein